MRNHPPPRKYNKFSALHARCMALFDTLKDEYHHIGFDNLYNSAAFCREAFLHEKKPLVHGVTRKGGQGIPPCVQQEEVTSRTTLWSVRGTVKVAKLEGDSKCPCLLASSVYDTKPVHYLSMCSPKVEWIVKEKPVYNVDTQRTEMMRFLRLNQIDTYNHGMNDVDAADQLRGSYRMDHWMRKRKWWWSIMFWAVGVTLTNSYLIYKKLCEEENKQPAFSHYKF